MRLLRSRPTAPRSTASSNSAVVTVFLAIAGRHQRSFVDQVGQVGPHHPRSQAGHAPQVYIRTQSHVANVNLENRFAAVDVGPIDNHDAVESAGPQQRGVERLRPVGCRHDDHAAVRVKTVHFHQQLIQRLLALIVAAGDVAGPRLPQRIQLVDEDDARRLSLGPVKQVAHPGCANADKHLHEIGAAHAEERHRRLACHCPGQQRLAGSRRADKQDPFGNMAAENLVFLRSLKKIDDFTQLGYCLVNTRHILESAFHVLLSVQLVAAAAECQCRPTTHQPTPEQDRRNAKSKEEHEPHPDLHDAPEGGVFLLAAIITHGLIEQGNQSWIVLQPVPLRLEADFVLPSAVFRAIGHEVAAGNLPRDVGITQRVEIPESNVLIMLGGTATLVSVHHT